MFVFWKIWLALIFCYLRFEILPFALSPTIFFVLKRKKKGVKKYEVENLFQILLSGIPKGF